MREQCARLQRSGCPLTEQVRKSGDSSLFPFLSLPFDAFNPHLALEPLNRGLEPTLRFKSALVDTCSGET